jgi:hypothetical protein
MRAIRRAGQHWATLDWSNLIMTTVQTFHQEKFENVIAALIVARAGAAKWTKKPARAKLKPRATA